MPRTPGVEITDIDETRDPLVSDDVSQALDVGSRWINTTSGAIFYCVDNSAGAAVWINVSEGSHPVTAVGSDPLVTSDSDSGFTVGWHWINTATRRIFQAVSVSVGAAVWDRVNQPKVNIAAGPPAVTNDDTEGYEIGSWWIETTPPTKLWRALGVATGAAEWKRETDRKTTFSASDPVVTNDNTEGYEVLSRWVNTTTGEVFTLTDASTGLAIWKPDSNVPGAGKQTPKEHFYSGDLLVYGAVGTHSLSSNTIQYTRVWLTAGLVLEKIRVFIDSGGSAGRQIRLGLYDQADPSDESLGPNNKVAETAEVGTNTVGYLDTNLGSNYTVLVTGYYWIALVTDSNSVKFALTNIVYRADFTARRAESTSGNALPATASGLTNPQASLTYASAVEP